MWRSTCAWLWVFMRNVWQERGLAQALGNGQCPIKEIGTMERKMVLELDSPGSKQLWNFFLICKVLITDTPSKGCVDHLISGAGSTTGWVFDFRQVVLLLCPSFFSYGVCIMRSLSPKVVVKITWINICTTLKTPCTKYIIYNNQHATMHMYLWCHRIRRDI